MANVRNECTSVLSSLSALGRTVDFIKNSGFFKTCDPKLKSLILQVETYYDGAAKHYHEVHKALFEEKKVELVDIVGKL